MPNCRALCLVFACALLGVVAAADVLVLERRWQPTACSEGGSCTPNYKDAFVVQRIYQASDANAAPQTGCTGGGGLKRDDLDASDLDEAELECAYYNATAGLKSQLNGWRDVWNDFGRCTAAGDALTYLALGLDLDLAYPLPLDLPAQVDGTALAAAIKKAFGAAPKLTCQGGKLAAVSLCFPADAFTAEGTAKPVDCPWPAAAECSAGLQVPRGRQGVGADCEAYVQQSPLDVKGLVAAAPAPGPAAEQPAPSPAVAPAGQQAAAAPAPAPVPLPARQAAAFVAPSPSAAQAAAAPSPAPSPATATQPAATGQAAQQAAQPEGQETASGSSSSSPSSNGGSSSSSSSGSSSGGSSSGSSTDTASSAQLSGSAAPAANSTTEGDSGTSTGAMVGALAGGIVAGVVAGLAAFGGGYYWWTRRRTAPSAAAAAKPGGDDVEKGLASASKGQRGSSTQSSDSWSEAGSGGGAKRVDSRSSRGASLPASPCLPRRGGSAQPSPPRPASSGSGGSPPSSTTGYGRMPSGSARGSPGLRSYPLAGAAAAGGHSAGRTSVDNPLWVPPASPGGVSSRGLVGGWTATDNLLSADGSEEGGSSSGRGPLGRSVSNTSSGSSWRLARAEGAGGSGRMPSFTEISPASGRSLLRTGSAPGTPLRPPVQTASGTSQPRTPHSPVVNRSLPRTQSGPGAGSTRQLLRSGGSMGSGEWLPERSSPSAGGSSLGGSLGGSGKFAQRPPPRGKFVAGPAKPIKYAQPAGRTPASATTKSFNARSSPAKEPLQRQPSKLDRLLSQGAGQAAQAGASAATGSAAGPSADGAASGSAGGSQ